MTARRPKSFHRPPSIGDIAIQELLTKEGEWARAAEQLFYHEFGCQSVEATSRWANLDEADKVAYSQRALALLRTAAALDAAIVAPDGPRLAPGTTLLLISG
jgi:hypothetical protein